MKLTMYDPFNYYAVGEVWLWPTYTKNDEIVTDVETVEEDGVSIQKISANQSDNSVFFSGLDPDTTYSVVFGYYDETATFIQADYTSFTTSSLDKWISVTSVALQYVTLNVKLDASADTPTDARIYIFGQQDQSTNTDSLDTLGITVSGSYGSSDDYTNITSYISQMTKSGGVAVTSSATEAFISTDSTVGSEENAYVLVVVVGTYDGVVEEIGRQMVRNPYYGMSVYYNDSTAAESNDLAVGIYSMSDTSSQTATLITSLQETVSALTEELSSLQSTVNGLSSSSNSSGSTDSGSSDSGSSDSGSSASDNSTESEEQSEEEAALAAIAEIQSLLDALPNASTVTEANADAIGALLDDIDDARAEYYSTYKSTSYASYLDDLDYTRYDALCAALENLSLASPATATTAVTSSTAATAVTAEAEEEDGDDDDDESEAEEEAVEEESGEGESEESGQTETAASEE
ncbi:MAG: hypothetical protein LUH19_09225 [Lachnospiraceae bacterium]|nr:hypothetical protein [Lachnospiraceae bacterium]